MKHVMVITGSEEEGISTTSAGSIDRVAMTMRANLLRETGRCLVKHSENDDQYPNPSETHIIKTITDEAAHRHRNERGAAIHQILPASSDIPSRSCA